MNGVPKPLLTVQQAAVWLNCHPETVRRAIRAGKLAAYRRTNCTRVSEADLVAYLNTFYQPAEPGADVASQDETRLAALQSKKAVDDFRLALRIKRALARR